MSSADPSRPVRVLLVEDHDMVAEALQLALDGADGITVVGRARSRAEAVADVLAHAPDVVLLDRRLANGDALGIVAQLGAGGARVLVLTGDATPAIAVQVAKAGGAGLLLKSSQLGVLETAVRDVAAGGVVFDPDLLSDVFDRLTGRSTGGTALTARERETLDLLAEGATTEEIGRRLGVSRNTTRNHVQRVLEKLGARSKLEAVAVARREGLIG
ncbi:response regulator transcription factor [Amycolatopsis sp. NPDC004169]|uniref:response regulator transcription factor n=1 Tax=Amycolatopsis sp. NPDC004169 TaxID=3154453 RepID=UPI0033A346F0